VICIVRLWVLHHRHPDRFRRIGAPGSPICISTGTVRRASTRCWF
jgi:hypothetical protein